MPKTAKNPKSLALYEAIVHLSDPEECYRFFEDLCTPTELRSMEQRYDVAVRLMREQVYTEILENTGASSATISRVRRNILESNGEDGAICRMIRALGLDDKEESTE